MLWAADAADMAREGLYELEQEEIYAAERFAADPLRGLKFMLMAARKAEADSDPIPF